MQINSKISYLTSKRVLWWIKTIIFLVILYAVYLLIRKKGGDIQAIGESLHLIYSPQNIPFLVVVILLTPINWAFEAWKWQKLALKIENITFWEAYRGVLVGLTFATATPMMLGDYAGKILMLKSDKRLQSIGAILLGNGMQLYVSLLFGAISYVFFIIWSQPTPIFLHFTIVFILIIALLTGLLLSFQFQKIDNLSTENKILKYILKYISILKYYNIQELRNVFFIASARYIVFTIQFLIVLKIFGVNLSISILLAGIGIIFLAKTLGSVLNFLGDLSIRELTSVYYFSYFGSNTSLIASATLMIWLINVLLPIVVGSLFILQLKITIKKI
ncbi:lysylphosphatidylglycerol synthase domain-containing protein [Emticicia sp. SJ17W-69]|uniref:lysylphosphatidylglycerol synthase domain-containing protein n=1 Tax=Emticicia sp. SJ17W-69 TaxID=3421657 RepID=UPI003EC09A3F